MNKETGHKFYSVSQNTQAEVRTAAGPRRKASSEATFKKEQSALLNYDRYLVGKVMTA
ncbi:MAG: hypothetical protein ABI361_06875 [Nitrososphaera sp.]